MTHQTTAPIEIEHAYIEFDQARAELQHAQSNFNLAAPDYIDIAAYDLRIAEERTDNSLRKIRLLLGQAPRPRNVRQAEADKRLATLFGMLDAVDVLSNHGRKWLIGEIVSMRRDMRAAGLVT